MKNKIHWWKIWLLVAMLVAPVLVAHIYPARAEPLSCSAVVSDIPIIKNTNPRRIIL